MLIRAIQRAAAAYSREHIPLLGAALAYYTIFSVAPVLIIAIAIAGKMFGQDAARGKVMTELETYVGVEPAKFVQNLIVNASEPKSSTWATAIGLTMLLYAAFSLLTQLRTSLQTIWRLDQIPCHGLWEYTKGYVFAFITMPCIGLFLAASLATSTMLSAAGEEWADDIYGGAKTWRGIEIGASILLVTLLLALVFRLLSDRRIAWKDVWGGAFIGAVLFTAGKTLIGMYLGYTNTMSAFGAAGSLVVFLIWVYYSAQIVFIGAAVVPVRLPDALQEVSRATPR